MSGIKKFYQNEKYTMVDASLKKIDDPRWDKISEFLSQKEHETSFRKLTDILGQAAEMSPKGKNVTFDDVIASIKEFQHKLNVSDAEMEKFINSLK